MATILTGKFPDKDGTLTSFDRMPVEVTRDGRRLHFRVTGSGAGSATLDDGSARGLFRTLDGNDFGFEVETEPGGIRYRIFQGTAQIATGRIFNLPP